MGNVSIETNPGGIIGDDAGRQGQISQGGEQLTGFRIDDISVNFQYGISTNDIKDGGSTTGTGAVGGIGSQGYVEVGTGVGSAALESRDSVRYRAGHECYCKPSVVFPEPETNVNMYMGFLNGDDGWAVGYQDLEFGLWFIEGGNINFIPRSDWNVDKLDGAGPSGFQLDPQLGNEPSLKYTWHGFKDLSLEFDLGDGKEVLCHRIRSTNTAIEPHLENPNLPMTLKIERTSGTGANLRITTGSWRGGVVTGKEENNASDRWFAEWVVGRSKSLDALHADHLVTLRSKDLFQGKTNHIKVEVKLLNSTNATNKDLVFIATRMGALDAADQAAIEAGFADINTADSVLESSTVVRLFTTVLPKSSIGDVAVVGSDKARDNQDVQGFDIYPGEDTVFGVLGSATGTVSIQMNMKELH